jgi:hypothetical protein
MSVAVSATPTVPARLRFKLASPLVMRTWSSAMWRKAANVRREWQKAWALRHKMTLKEAVGNL